MEFSYWRKDKKEKISPKTKAIKSREPENLECSVYLWGSVYSLYKCIKILVRILLNLKFKNTDD